MPNRIDLRVDQDSALDHTLQRALELLRQRGILVRSAAQVYDAGGSPLARIILLNASDKNRAIETLLAAQIPVQ